MHYGHGKIDRVGEGTQILFFATPSYFLSSEEDQKALRLSHRWINLNPHPPRSVFFQFLSSFLF